MGGDFWGALDASRGNQNLGKTIAAPLGTAPLMAGRCVLKAIPSVLRSVHCPTGRVGFFRRRLGPGEIFVAPNKFNPSREIKNNTGYFAPQGPFMSLTILLSTDGGFGPYLPAPQSSRETPQVLPTLFLDGSCFQFLSDRFIFRQ